MDKEELEARFDGEYFRWECPTCTEINESDIDPRGEEVTCDCGWTGKCGSEG